MPEGQFDFSIIIPAYNEAAYLPQCLKSAQRQTGGFKIEIIVADNNSTDQTAAIAEAMGARVVRESRQGVGAARRAGVAAASGDYILNIDADTRLPPNYLEEVFKRFQKCPALACLGGQFVYYDAPWWKNFLRPFVHHLLRLFALLASGGRIGPMGNNMVFRKDFYDKTRGFNEALKFGEDIDLCRQLSELGKIKLDMGLKCFISVRRYQINSRLFTYLLNFIKMCFSDAPHRNEL